MIQNTKKKPRPYARQGILERASGMEGEVPGSILFIRLKSLTSSEKNENERIGEIYIKHEPVKINGGQVFWGFSPGLMAGIIKDIPVDLET